MQVIKFGTDGWRAIMEKEFTDENLERLAQAFALFVNEEAKRDGKEAKIVIGYDFRKRSDEFALKFAQIMLGNDIKICLSDKPVPTQAVSRAVTNHGYLYGIAITASHNPGAYNGVKIKDAGGSSAEIAVTSAVEKLIDKQDKKISSEESVKPFIKDIFGEYWSGVKEYLQMDRFNDFALSVIIDSMHGVGATHILELLAGTSVKITSLRGNRDATFGGVAPEPIAKNFADMVSQMKQNKFDAGFATDGDADRVGAVRPGGDFVSPGTLLTLIMIHFVEDLGWTGDVVTTVSNTGLIYKVATSMGLKVHETPVGFKYIVDVMRRENVLIAGEESGGLAFQNYMLERDGLLSALLLIQMMQFRKKTFEQILLDTEAKYGKFIYHRYDGHYPGDAKPKLLAHLKELEIKEIEGVSVRAKRTDDGIKFTLDNDGWLLFRMSGTEPLLRIYAESTTPGKAKSFVEWGKGVAEKIKS